jgi:hypothetical protein
LGRKDDRFQAAGAYFIDCGRIGAGFQAGTQRDLTRRRLADTRLHHIAEEDFLDDGRVDLF